MNDYLESTQQDKSEKTQTKKGDNWIKDPDKPQQKKAIRNYQKTKRTISFR